MITIDRNNIVSMTRGDTFNYPLFINMGNEMSPTRYVLQDNEEVYLAIMQPNEYFEDAILKKKFTKADLNENGDIQIRIEHDDTKCLIPGKYYLQIKAKLYDKKIDGSLGINVNTIIDKTEFFIME